MSERTETIDDLSPEALDRLIDELQDEVAPPSATEAAIPRRSGDGPAPLSSGQEQIWILERMGTELPVFNLPAALRCRGELDPDALRHALEMVLARHEALRTRFVMRDGQPVQEVLPAPGEGGEPFELSLSDLGDLPPDRRGDQAAELARETAREPFDLESGRLLRARLIRRGSGDHLLVLVLHHIAGDAWSVGVVVRELGAAYGSLVGGAEPELTELPVQYADVAVHQRERIASGALEASVQAWRKRLAGLSPTTELPADHARPPVQSHRGERVAIDLSPEAVRGLERLARRPGTTPFMVLLAALFALVHRHGGEDDLAVGTPVANRGESALQSLVGFLVNTVVVRASLGGGDTFARLLDRVREATLAAFDGADVPFQSLVEALQPERNLARSPLFQIFFALQNEAVPTLELEGVALTEEDLHNGAAQFDLSWLLTRGDDGVTGWLEYVPELFERSTVERFVARYDRLLVAAGAAPETPVARLPMLEESLRHELLVERNRTAAPRPSGAETVHGLVRLQARHTPDAPAVSFDAHRPGAADGGTRWTYRQLDRRVSAIAAALGRHGVGRGDRVGVSLERGADLPAALLAVMARGAAYVPLDPTYPAPRLGLMVEDSGLGALVTGGAEEIRRLAPGLPVVDLSRPLGDDDGTRGDVAAAADAAGAEDAAYLIYTSGSTGRPKGVVVRHGEVTSFFTAMDSLIGPGGSGTAPQPPDPGVWLAVTSPAFDISVLELLWTLARGFEVVIAPDRRSSALAAHGGATLSPSSLPAVQVREARGRRVVEREALGRLSFGLFYFADAAEPAAASGDAPDRYRLLLEGARFADRHGFSAVWTPERHFHSFGGLYPNPAVTGAALAAVTERVHIRAGSVVLPLHDPVRVAEEWSVVDNLSRGRTGISFASGWHADDFVFAPDGFADRKRTMMEGIETVRRLWRGETVARQGGAGPVSVRLQPPPVEAELPVWITAAGNPETFREAGRLGAGVLTHLLSQSLDELADKIALYRQARKEAGLDPAAGNVTLMLHTFVGTDEAAVKEVVREPFKEYLASSLGLVRNLARSLGMGDDLSRLSEDDLDTLLEHAFERFYTSAALFGSPESCLGTLARVAAAGVDEIGCLIDFGVPTDASLEALDHLNRLRELTAATAVEAVEAAGAVGREPGAESLSALFERYRVTHLQCTPSMATLLMADRATREHLGGLERMLVGGEALPPVLASELTAVLGDGVLIDVYGPTETTVWSTAHPVVDPGSGPVPIGRPLANTAVYVVDRELEPVPPGVAGELVIGGQAVTEGYRGRPAQTAERFVPDPFSPVAGDDRVPGEPGARLYRTGDLARWRADGTLDFLGRLDHQVKIRGHRIELGEVESVIGEFPGVAESVVVAHGDGVAGRRLAAYVVASGAGRPVTRLELRNPLPVDVDTYVMPNGMTVVHLSDMQVSTGYREIFEEEIYLRHGVTLPDGATVLDVGGNIGLFTLFVHERCRSPRVVALEPIPPTAGALRANVELYGLDGVEVLTCGAGEKSGREIFTFYPNAPGLSGRYSGTDEDRAEIRATIADWRDAVGSPDGALSDEDLDALLADHLVTEEFEVELVTLSDILRERGIERVDLLKVDAEKSEAHVLAGLSDEDWPKIQQIVLEIHSRELLEEISGELRRRGFHLGVEEVAVVAEGDGRTPVDVVMLYGTREASAADDAGQGLRVDRLRRHLARRLPEPMVPTDLVLLDELPRTPNGKVDRRRLPDPTVAAGSAARYVPPGNELERRIVAIWQDVLGRDRIGARDNFFEVGGNSLLLVQVQGKLQEELDRPVEVVQIFRHPTVQSLAGALAESSEESASETARERSRGRAERSQEAREDDLAQRQRAFRGRRRRRSGGSSA